jgi:hypothetical protein
MPMILLTSSKLPLAAAAVFAVGIGCSSIAADGTGLAEAAPEEKAPVACALDISNGLFGLTFEGTVEALTEDVEGSYEFRVEKSGRSGSATIVQGGEFRLRAGERETLGEATMNGKRSEFDAALTLDVDGKRFACPGSNRPIDL